MKSKKKNNITETIDQKEHQKAFEEFSIDPSVLEELDNLPEEVIEV